MPNLLSIFELNNQFTDLNILTVFLRLFFAVLLGGIIGLERGSNKQAAGFRTHILVCVGASLAMLTNQYVVQFLSPASDPTRMAAQVITGVGFLGVGTILVTGKYKIKGLTTAAGLWASACIGLALGIGFYLGAFIASFLVFLCLEVFIKLESHVYSHSRTMDIYLELTDVKAIKSIRAKLSDLNVIIHDGHISKSDLTPNHGITYQISIRLPKKINAEELLEILEVHPGVYLVQDF